ncbi:hypothetical protein ADL26_13535, partial [Thermoactinomyces vulgaris]
RQGVHDMPDRGLVVDGDARELRLGREQLLHGALHGGRVVGAGPDLGPGPGAVEEALAHPLGEAGAAGVDRLGGAEQRDVVAAAVHEVPRAHPAGRLEVEVDAGEAFGVGGESDEDARESQAPQGLHARVAHLDVHEDQT